ncbi:hypothetical protein SAMN05421796_10343 [Chryseobacterium piscicola]|uniref:Uncharacterized protein n=1 Tax=Chryseobacterium piscicola TaxID=551459 RepID=A0A1N7LS79_9FLAO|nr:hypothetical protein [Chryseobacterium piscicola]PQA91820.1 hypothetical protein B0A70_12055 [Chryseobacterium piscicola]SIS76686.1 hypothetical protein SAMN05421796_10343 [Chryseobacterium piscicola]
MKKLFLILSIIFSILNSAQQSEIFKLKKYRVSALNDSIRETSGLSFFNEKLYTFNDSGNTPELYQIDEKSGKIIKVLKVNAENKDWESIANDGKNFYIGEFGNNEGTRKDLKIYKIPFNENQLQNDSLKTISFFYPNQKDFTPKNIATDFDLESMIYLNGKIHIFTKEWVSKSTTHYILDPNNFEKQAAQEVEFFKTGFMISDAYYFDKKLYVVGYTKKTEVYLTIFYETELGIFFKEKPKKYYLGSALSIGQIEGIAVDHNGIYISGEKFYNPIKNSNAFFYFVPKGILKF